MRRTVVDDVTVRYLASVVQKLDNAIQLINHYLSDLVDGDLSN